MITKLTDAQQAAMPGWVEKWIANGLSTAPANFSEAERGVRGCYEYAGLRQPLVVLHVGSPLAAVLGGIYGVVYLNAFAESQVGSQVWSQVWSQVGSQVASQVRSQVESQVASQVRSQVESQVESQVWSQVESQVRSQVGSQVRSQVGSQVWSQVGSQVWSQVASQVESQVWSQYRGGNLWSGWYAYASFFREICGLRIDNYEMDELYARNASWCWYHDKVAAIADRPRKLERNARGQLHNINGPALQYSDGWSLYFIDGIALDEQIVMRPETQTISQINAEKNADVKSIRIQRFGWPRYLLETKAKCLDECKNDVEGTREALYVAPTGERRLVATCPTGRVFAMGVPPEISTCEQARQWLQPKPFNIIART